MGTIAEMGELRLTISGLRGAMATDDQRLRDAAARAGVLYTGCDTAETLADEVLGLRADLAALRKAAQRFVAAHKRWEQCPTDFLSQRVIEARNELAALDAAERREP